MEVILQVLLSILHPAISCTLSIALVKKDSFRSHGTCALLCDVLLLSLALLEERWRSMNFPPSTVAWVGQRGESPIASFHSTSRPLLYSFHSTREKRFFPLPWHLCSPV